MNFNDLDFKLGKTCTRTRKVCMAILCSLLIVIIVVLAMYSTGKLETFKMPTISLKEQRRSNPLIRPLREEDPQPLYFKNQKLSVPKNCQPHYGCFFTPGPSAYKPDEGTQSVPAAVREADLIYCTEAWRDCAAYRDCVDGKCVVKKHNH